MSELDPGAMTRFKAVAGTLRDLGPNEVRSRLAGLVAEWPIPRPGEVEDARRRGLPEPVKPRATAQEMAERRVVTCWLVAEAGRPLSRRGVAYRAEALLDLPKTAKAFWPIEEAKLDLRDWA